MRVDSMAVAAIVPNIADGSQLDSVPGGRPTSEVRPNQFGKRRPGLEVQPGPSAPRGASWMMPQAGIPRRRCS